MTQAEPEPCFHASGSQYAVTALQFPGFGARLTGGGNGVELPALLAGFCIVGCDEATNSVLAAADADNDFILDRERSHRDRVACLAIRHIRFPEEMTAPGIDRHQVRVEGAHVERVPQNRDAAAIRAAANHDFRIVVVVIDPENTSGNRVHRDHIIRPLSHIHDSVDYQGCRFPAARDSRLIHPRKTEVFRVRGRDLSERTEAVTKIIASIH